MEFEQKEKYEGVYSQTGESVRFTRTFAGHRFTDEECEALLNGKTIAVRNLVSAKGKKYGVTGKLSQQEYNGYTFWGFERLGFINDIPEEICGHRFTEEEKSDLKSGKQVLMTDCVSAKSGKAFGAKVHYDDEKGKLEFDEFYNGKEQEQPAPEESATEDPIDFDDIDLEIPADDLPF